MGDRDICFLLLHISHTQMFSTFVELLISSLVDIGTEKRQTDRHTDRYACGTSSTEKRAGVGPTARREDVEKARTRKDLEEEGAGLQRQRRVTRTRTGWVTDWLLLVESLAVTPKKNIAGCSNGQDDPKGVSGKA